MNEYAQPDFYRFSEDSLRLVNHVLQRVDRAVRVLDLGAGCGIIGIELAKILSPESLTLVEAQHEFIPFLESNTSSFIKSTTRVSILQKSFSGWNPTTSYDLIVCNPPYFFPGHGIESPDKRKQVCRTFVLDSWDLLLRLTWKCLAPGGRAYFVIRNDDRLLKMVKGHPHESLISVEEKKGLFFLELLRLDVN